MVRCLTASSDDLPSIRARLIPGISSCRRALALLLIFTTNSHPTSPAQRKDLIHNV